MHNPNKNQKLPILGITHGDINGISYEIILKALKDPRMLELCTPVIYGSPKVAGYYKKVLKHNTLINIAQSIDNINRKSINIINCATNKIRVEVGKSTEMAGQASLNALRHSLVDIKAKKLDILVTAPINKKNIQTEGFNFAGHTRFFASEFEAENIVMLMAHENLRIGVVTEHISVSDVAKTINVDIILSKLKVINNSLKNDLAIDNPKIAVLGLNPHAGDEGLIGKEEQEIIIPAIEKANNEGVTAIGPFPADGFFGSGTYEKYDAVLAMYHDQGLIPFKTITRNNGVNFTAGLPFVRTSPAHGTAYEIAGKNIASANSFKQAIYMALDVYHNRKMLEDAKNDNFEIENNVQADSGASEGIR